VLSDPSRIDHPRAAAAPPARPGTPAGTGAARLTHGERNALYRTTSTRLPLVLVVASLALALLVPRLAQRRVNRLRDDINLFADPARTDVAAIELDLALEAAARRGYALTGDAQLAHEITVSLRRRRAAEQRLNERVRQLGDDVPTALATLATRLRAFDVELDSLVRRGVIQSEPSYALRDREGLFDAAMTAAQRLDSAIVRVADARRSAIATTENTVAALTAVLVVLGLGAALLVARLGNRFRAVALRLDESDARFRQIAENLHTVVWLSDPDFRNLLYVNGAYERIWGRSPEQLYSDADAFIEGVHPDDRAAVRDALAAIHDGGSDVEFRIVRPNGAFRWAWGRGFPVRDDAGRVFRMAGIIEDITERRQYQVERESLLENERRAREAAERRRHELEEVTLSRARLVRGFTHDVKNPLGAADGFLALLEEGVNGALPAPSRDWIGKARRAIDHALELIRSLLDIARAEAGELEIHWKETDVAALVREVAEAMAAQAASKRLTLVVDVPDWLPSVRTDAMRIRQVVGNLLSNAVKYTAEGGHVRIAATVEQDAADAAPPRLAISVSDDGRGIPEHQLPLLFAEFTRFDPDAAEGAGIGLAISRKIAEALGARITVESEVGRGSTFTLHLPLSRPS
jgi:PAS domain S-box-containing protein